MKFIPEHEVLIEMRWRAGDSGYQIAARLAEALGHPIALSSIYDFVRANNLERNAEIEAMRERQKAILDRRRPFLPDNPTRLVRPGTYPASGFSMLGGKVV